MVGCHKGIREIETNVANNLRVVNPAMYPVLQEIISFISSVYHILIKRVVHRGTTIMKNKYIVDDMEMFGKEQKDNTDYLMIAGSAIVLISFFSLLTALVYLIK